MDALADVNSCATSTVFVKWLWELPVLPRLRRLVQGHFGAAWPRVDILMAGRPVEAQRMCSERRPLPGVLPVFDPETAEWQSPG